MSLDMFLSTLREQQIGLRADGDQLHCDAPPGVLTPDLLAQIAGRKEQMLEFLRLSEVNRPDENIVIADRGQTLPLSYAQERFWFLDRFIEDRAVYNVPLALELRGELDPDALQNALTGLVERHEALRAAFGSNGNQSYQRIGLPYAVELPRDDLSHEPAAELETQMRRLAAEELRRPFSLVSSRLLRARLVVMGPRRHVLLITIHHIACDAWSLDLLVGQLRALYASLTRGTAAPAWPALHYADYAIWQRDRAQHAAGIEKLAQAAQNLRGSTTGTLLASDHSRPALQTYHGAVHRVAIPAGVMEPLRRLAAGEEASPFIAFVAIAKLLLFRYTRESDISLGVPSVGRTDPKSQDLVGCFLNTLVLRSALDGAMSGRVLLRAVRAVCLEAYELQDVPFERLVEALQLPRDLSYNPLFQVMVSMQSEPVAGVAGDGLHWCRIEVDNETAKVDLSIEIKEHGDGGALLLLRYNRDLFDRVTMQRMGSHYVRLLTAVGATPDHAIGTLPMLTPSERDELVLWNAPTFAPAEAHTVHGVFEAQVRLHPDRTALRCDGRTMSYRALNDGANRLAHLMIARGLRPGQLVGICHRRSLQMVQAILATWKAGAAYVPLDPSYPAERTAFMLNDADVAFILCNKALAATLPPNAAVTLAVDGEVSALIDGASVADPLVAVAGDALSHVIYTSGSTGRPKGTMIEHRNVLALLQWARRTWTDGELAHVLASTSICFDLSVFELLAPLVTGGCVHLVENILHLAQHDAREQVTLINTVPSALTQLLRSGALPSSVRVVNLAGEPLLRPLVNMAYALPQVEAVYNLYGPSEDTTYSTYVKVPRHADDAPTIGRPLPGKQVHILDPELQPVPVGQLGEIYIAGAGLARGYLNRPELTAERFILHPAGGMRLYRTGDLGRWRHDGEIVYAGRSDLQVKIRGFRIELGEIECVLRVHPRVAEAALLVQRDHGNDPALAAYVVARPGGIDLAALRAHLRQQLPAFMLPATITILASMPMTLNGKIDRNALPAPRTTEREARGAPARNDLERDIAAIWRELLGDVDVGVNANFFEAGGHSLLVLQMHSRLMTLLGRSLPIIELFRNPTIRSLAEQLQAAAPVASGFAPLNSRVSKQRAAIARRRELVTAAAV